MFLNPYHAVKSTVAVAALCSVPEIGDHTKSPESIYLDGSAAVKWTWRVFSIT